MLNPRNCTRFTASGEVSDDGTQGRVVTTKRNEMVTFDEKMDLSGLVKKDLSGLVQVPDQVPDQDPDIFMLCGVIVHRSDLPPPSNSE